MDITVEQARQALAQAHSEASDSHRFAARRVEGGWRFSWALGRPVPVGTGSWVVSDGGGVRRLRFGDTTASAIAALDAG